MEQFDVFISYRRENASESARIFQQFLEGKGLRVFLDVDSLVRGHFDKQILQHIDQCRHFLFIASPGSLDRCVNEDDWVRLEIAHALKIKKNVVPVVMEKFEWPKPMDLPVEIRELSKYHAFEYRHTQWKDTQGTLLNFLDSKRGIAQTMTDFKLPDWAEIVALEPNPDIVTDGKLRKAILDTKYPWHVKDKKSGIEMLLVPPGIFKMGAAETDGQATDAEKPLHLVKIPESFYLSKWQVTQHQWHQVIGRIWKSKFLHHSKPVENLSFNACYKFLQVGGFRLPTEAEWEYACRAGLEDKPRYGEPDEIAWYKNNSDDTTKLVGKKIPNGFGFYDMLGNVAEWCSDLYWSEYYKDFQPVDLIEPCEPFQDPKGLLEEQMVEIVRPDLLSSQMKDICQEGEKVEFERTIRGGSYCDGEEYCRASSRRGYNVNEVAPFVGFRVARSIK